MQGHDDHVTAGQVDHSSEPPVSRERLAYHEAGHAVVLHALGVRANSVSIKREGSFLGITWWDNPLTSLSPDSPKLPEEGMPHFVRAREHDQRSRKLRQRPDNGRRGTVNRIGN
jgi:hypothetical protein